MYQAKVKYENEEQSYIGLTATSFKLRHSNHKTTFKYAKNRGKTSLAGHIWDLKDRGVEYQLEWGIIGRAQPFSPISGVCNLCTLEKFHIYFTPEMGTLNQKDEINNWCPHKSSMLLDKTWFPRDQVNLGYCCSENFVIILSVVKFCLKIEGIMYQSWNTV